MSRRSNPLLSEAGSFLVSELVQFAETAGIVFAAMDIVKQAGTVDSMGIINELWSKNPGMPLTPAALADMVERNIISEGEGAAEAALTGTNADRFHLLVQDTGEPPGIMEMLALYRRGELDEGTLREMIAYSRIRTKWTDEVLKLRFQTMSGADAIEAVVKGVMSQGEGADLWGKAGGMADQYQTLLNAAGDAIGVEQVLMLWKHGHASLGDVEAVIRHSRVNPEFEPLAAELWHHYLGAYEIEKAVKAGSATPGQASTWLDELGYPADQTAAFIGMAQAPAVAKAKELTEAQILTLYEAKFITSAEATKELEALKYPADQIPFILEITDARRALSQLTKAITATQHGYVLGRVSEANATADLSSLGVPPAAQREYLKDWDIERSLEFKTLTMAQVGILYKKGGLSGDQAKARWQAMGYDPEDQALLLFDYGGPPPTGSPAAAKGA